MGYVNCALKKIIVQTTTLPDLADGVSGSGRFPGLIILFREPMRSRSDSAGLGGGIGRCGGID